MAGTRSVSILVPITTPVRLLPRNPFRTQYVLTNLDAANFIRVGSHKQVNANAAAAADFNTGDPLTAGQHVSDDLDTDEVWAVANTAAVWVHIMEMTHNPRGPRVRERGTRTF